MLPLARRGQTVTALTPSISPLYLHRTYLAKMSWLERFALTCSIKRVWSVVNAAVRTQKLDTVLLEVYAVCTQRSTLVAPLLALATAAHGMARVRRANVT